MYVVDQLFTSEWPRPSNAGVQQVRLTFFKNAYAKRKDEQEMTLAALACRIQMSHAPTKEDLPWLKLARFGDIRTDKGSLRHDANVLAVYGVEVDYDGEKVSFAEACETIKKAGIQALIYTSPRHTEGAPRWRVLCLFSQELAPAQRYKMVARLSGVLGGIVFPESFNLSLSYYYGSVGDSPPCQVQIIDGDFIDLRSDLDAGAIGKPASTPITNNHGSAGNTRAAAVIPLFPGQSPPTVMAARPSAMVAAAQANLSQSWFDNLTPEQMDACLEAIATHPATIARSELNRSLDGGWRNTLWGFVDAAQRGAPRARETALKWAQNCNRFTQHGFDQAWNSFKPDGVGLGSLVWFAEQDGIDLTPWRDPAQAATTGTVAQPATTVVSTKPPLWVDAGEWVEADLPIRPWIAYGFALRRAVTEVDGPPAGLKSSLMLCWADSVALGKPHGDFQPKEPAKVIVFNAEDDAIEQRRRLSGALHYFNATPADIRGKLIRVGANAAGTLFMVDARARAVSPTPAMRQLRALVEEHRPAMLIVDPLIETHTADENDNSGMRAVLAEFRALASEFDMAVVITHHPRKGAVTPGDPDAGRGASAPGGLVRVKFTLIPNPID